MLGKIGGYLKGAWSGLSGGAVGGLGRAGKAGFRHGSELTSAAWSTRGAMTGQYGRTLQGTAIGGAVGAGWGMASDDTSVIGGALMGAGLGAGGARYGGAGGLSARYARGGMKTRAKAFGAGVANRARRDVMAARVRSNKPLNKVRSTLKNWNT